MGFSGVAKKEDSSKQLAALEKAIQKDVVGVRFNGNVSMIRVSAALSENTSNIEDFTFHPDIADLLWFADGAYKNIDVSLKPACVFEIKDGDKVIGSIKISVNWSGRVEPSAIYTDMMVVKAPDGQIVPRPPYYPEYKELLPEQKFSYLNMLCNPYNDQIDIGYIFILYYGLERHILMGKQYLPAAKAILNLRKVHKNKSFLAYSASALLYAAILHRDKNLLDEISQQEAKFAPEIDIFIKATYDKTISADDLVYYAKRLGFKNDRYIKEDREFFINILEKVIIEKQGKKHIDVRKYLTPNTPMTYGLYLANISLENRTIAFPNIFDVEDFREDCFSLLVETHERIKKGKRKKKSLVDVKE